MPGISSLDEIREKPSLRVLPNPALDDFQLLLNGKAVQEGELSIFNLEGKEVLFERIAGFKVNVPRKTLPSGLYLLRYTCGHHYYTEKLLLR
ncbi:MAG: T9SS type A sorting domain-containing protein [Bacteroidia bacterium]|nr:T9SS type A sorting domain-containing protein [Bacteroidia bacterium]